MNGMEGIFWKLFNVEPLFINATATAMANTHRQDVFSFACRFNINGIPLRLVAFHFPTVLPYFKIQPNVMSIWVPWIKISSKNNDTTPFTHTHIHTHGESLRTNYKWAAQEIQNASSSCSYLSRIFNRKRKENYNDRARENERIREWEDEILLNELSSPQLYHKP